MYLGNLHLSVQPLGFFWATVVEFLQITTC